MSRSIQRLLEQQVREQSEGFTKGNKHIETISLAEKDAVWDIPPGDNTAKRRSLNKNLYSKFWHFTYISNPLIVLTETLNYTWLLQNGS